MLKKKFSVLWIPTTVILLGLVLSAAQHSRAASDANNTEADKIMVVMEHAYQLMHGTSVRTFDSNRFGEVFIDTSDFQPSTGWQEYLSEMLSPIAAKEAGYLTAMQTKWKHFQTGDRLARVVVEKAQKEKRDVTSEEWQMLAKQNHGLIPPMFDEPDGTYKPHLVYESIKIDGDKAIVRYDDGEALQEAILRSVNGRWYIADISPIHVHF